MQYPVRFIVLSPLREPTIGTELRATQSVAAICKTTMIGRPRSSGSPGRFRSNRRKMSLMSQLQPAATAITEIPYTCQDWGGSTGGDGSKFRCHSPQVVAVGVRWVPQRLGLRSARRKWSAAWLAAWWASIWRYSSSTSAKSHSASGRRRTSSFSSSTGCRSGPRDGSRPGGC